MKKFLFGLSFFLFIFFTSFIAVPKTSSDELNDITGQINNLTSALNMSINATKPLESQLKSLENQINSIKSRVLSIEQDLAIKKKNIDSGYKNLAKQEQLLYRAIRDFYIKSYYNSPLLVFLSSTSASKITQVLAYQKAATDQDKIIITNIALSIEDLETKKKNLETEQQRLSAIKINLDTQSAKLDKIVEGAKSYQAVLSSQIAQLTAQQQQLISQRQAALNIPRSAGTVAPACVDDRDKDSGFSPRLAFFTYGVPNRTGLNQFGAKGRAETGQNTEQILQAYYDSFELKKDYDTGITIQVEGYGGYNIEDYVKRIYEMPASWPIEALKAQAIAARSYALAYTENGKNSICTTEKCQVFKPEEKGGEWNRAVEETRGWVMVQGGNPVKAWYSSTHGGYILATSELPGWQSTSWTKHAVDTTTGSSGNFSDLSNNAYDKSSPWFYCDWGSRSQYNKTAWMKPEEVADIINIILLAKTDPSSNPNDPNSIKDKLYQTDKPHPYGRIVWDADKVKSELRSRNISPYNNISDLSVSADFGAGKTTSISVSGDAGSQAFDGSEFKNFFNLRSPANIQIVGPLYNVERR